MFLFVPEITCIVSEFAFMEQSFLISISNFLEIERWNPSAVFGHFSFYIIIDFFHFLLVFDELIIN